MDYVRGCVEATIPRFELEIKRAHLEPEMPQPAPELQAEIAAWKRARLAQAARDKVVAEAKASGAEVMVVDG